MILHGDVLAMLATLPENHFHAVCTSPPYWAQRAYKTDPQVWAGDPTCAHVFGSKTVRVKGGPRSSLSTLANSAAKIAIEDQAQASTGSFCACGAWRGELGHEPTPDLFVAHLVEVFAGVRRVLREDGVCFLNMGDSYNAYNGNRGQSKGFNKNQHDELMPVASGHGLAAKDLKPKDLCLVPQRLALAMQADGWFVRQWIVWAKGLSGQAQWLGQMSTKLRAEAALMQMPAAQVDRLLAALASSELTAGSSMPESVKDRPSTSHETILMLTKSDSYFWDYEAVKETAIFAEHHAKYQGTYTRHKIETLQADGAMNGEQYQEGLRRGAVNPSRRNIRSVWYLNPGSSGEDHYASYPVELPKICLKAATSAHGCCAACGTPYERIVEKGEPLREQQQACGSDEDGLYDGEALKSYVNDGGGVQNPSDMKRRILAGMVETKTIGWKPTCACSNPHLADDDLDVIESPTGERTGEDPTLDTGRGGLNRPRGEQEGRRPITRFEQRAYADQLRQHPEREALEREAGEAFAHYIRKDRAGARPVPVDLLEAWIGRGILARVASPVPTNGPVAPCRVLDPFLGSGTTAVAAQALGLDVTGIELNAKYVEMATRRMARTVPLLAL